MGTVGRRPIRTILACAFLLSVLLFWPLAEGQTAASPDDVDLGIALDEQQGGGGLVGVTVRILNGNVVEVREDLRFASPNTLGLALGAAYNSRSGLLGSLGHGWTHTYEASLSPSVVIDTQTYLRIVAEAVAKAQAAPRAQVAARINQSWKTFR
jgi:hypothetical protein